jgi:tRNA (cytidine/uridine-2'-O-)-methyltransferase
MRVVLYQPDIPQNTGSILRTSACFGVAVDLVEPAGFPLDDRRLRRAGMDYLAGVSLTRHASWERYLELPVRGRLVLASAHGGSVHHDFDYQPDDRLLFGRETAGVPDHVRRVADAVVTIPIESGMRSLNVAVAAAILLDRARYHHPGN